MTERFANRAATTLDGGISNSATSLVVTAAAAFPNAGNFRILVDSGSAIEYMLVTGVSGSTFTVTRGIEGTTAVNHANGVQVAQVLTAGGLAQGIVDGLSQTPVAPTIVSASTYSYPTGVNTRANFDSTSNAIAVTIDPTPSPGQLMGAKDLGLALATHAVTILTAGAKIEWPAGNVTTSNVVLGAGDVGAGPLWQWFAAPYSAWMLPS